MYCVVIRRRFVRTGALRTRHPTDLRFAGFRYGLRRVESTKRRIFQIYSNVRFNGSKGKNWWHFTRLSVLWLTNVVCLLLKRRLQIPQRSYFMLLTNGPTIREVCSTRSRSTRIANLFLTIGLLKSSVVCFSQTNAHFCRCKIRLTAVVSTVEVYIFRKSWKSEK